VIHLQCILKVHAERCKGNCKNAAFL
jgi:hypothetical protein